MGDGPPLDDAYETPEWAKTNPDGSWKNPGNTSTSVSEGVTDEGVIATETKEEEVEILTDLKEYFELPDVGKELIGTAIFISTSVCIRKPRDWLVGWLALQRLLARARA